jgi:hypothetical protein
MLYFLLTQLEIPSLENPFYPARKSTMRTPSGLVSAENWQENPINGI